MHRIMLIAQLLVLASQVALNKATITHKVSVHNEGNTAVTAINRNLKHTAHSGFFISKGSYADHAVVHAAEAEATNWTGFGLAVLLVAALPAALLYSARLWHARNLEGQLSYQLKDVSEANILATGALVVYVTLLISTDTLASYTASMHGGHYPWQPVVVVMIVEGSKLLISLLLTIFFPRHTDYDEEVTWSLMTHAAVRLLPVGLLYAGNNCLVLFVLTKVDLGAYVVWRNTTVLFNALLWTFVLKRSLSGHQWMAVGFLFAGCSLNALDTDGSLSDVIGYPVLLMLLSAFFSALAAALNEGVLKNDAYRALGIDRLNCLLYFQTFSCLLMWILGHAAWTNRSVVHELPDLMSKLDKSAAALICMQTILGLSVSRVLLYADAVAKTMAGGAREIIQASVAPFFVASRLDWISFPSVIWIAVAMVTFFAPPPAPK